MAARPCRTSTDAVGRQSGAVHRGSREPLADPHRAAGGESVDESRTLRREQHDHGRAHVEPAELSAAVERDERIKAGQVAQACAVRRRRIRPDQARLMLPTKSAPTSTTAIGPAAVSKTQAMRSLRANSPGTPAAVAALTLNKSPGTMTRDAQGPGEGHVHAVIIVGREIDRREIAARELRRQRRIAAQQRRGRVVDALGLHQRVARDAAGLAHGAVGRAEGGARIGIEAGARRPAAGA